MRWLSDRTVAHLKHVAEWPDLVETKYGVLGEIGRGGMGTIYLAEDRVLGRRVALKVVSTGASDPAAAARMLREARVIARLEHPGIVPVHDAGTLPDGRMFYAMKRVDGRRLDEVALDGGAPLPDRLRVFQKVCEAVAFAHAHGVIHRDLKPENVMVGPFGEVLVMDWGVAKVLEEAAEPPAGAPSAGSATATSEGTVLGTPAYMAPEQAAGQADRVGPAADVYALGALLHFLLTRRPPFDDETAGRRARGETGLSPGPVPERRGPAPAFSRGHRRKGHGGGARGPLHIGRGARGRRRALSRRVPRPRPPRNARAESGEDLRALPDADPAHRRLPGHAHALVFLQPPRLSP